MLGSTPAHTARFALVAFALTACASATPATPPAQWGAAAQPSFGSGADAGAWQANHPQRMAELLEGRFPGVQVSALPGGGVSVRIRGASSAMLGTEPLYVVDGLPAPVGPGGALADVSPDDVQRIEVLRGSMATARWGSRGANGVILITTRRG